MYTKIVGVNIPTSFKITWHKLGGIFNKPTLLGNHGVGEAGPEAILPLNTLFDKMNNMFDNQNKTIVDSLKGSDRPINVTLNVDGEVLAKTTIENMKQLSQLGVLDKSWW